MIQELDRWRGTLAVRPDDFDSWSVGARFYPMLYVLSRVGGARDLGNGLQLSAGMLGAESRLHLHHIFPKARLYEVEYTMSQVNALGNFCFLTAHSNLVISASDPAVYLAEVEAAQPGVLASQWIPTDPDLWRIERYPEFLAARRALLAAAANELLESLHSGTQGDESDVPDRALPPRSPAPEYGEEPVLVELMQLARDLAIALPELHFEVIDDTGALMVMADLAWPEGIQPGRNEPVAFLLERDPEWEARLSELGYRFFVNKEHLVWHLEEVLGLDIDGDEVIGEAPS